MGKCQLCLFAFMNDVEFCQKHSALSQEGVLSSDLSILVVHLGKTGSCSCAAQGQLQESLLLSLEVGFQQRFDISKIISNVKRIKNIFSIWVRKCPKFEVSTLNSEIKNDKEPTKTQYLLEEEEIEASEVVIEREKELFEELLKNRSWELVVALQGSRGNHTQFYIPEGLQLEIPLFLSSPWKGLERFMGDLKNELTTQDVLRDQKQTLEFDDDGGGYGGSRNRPGGRGGDGGGNLPGGRGGDGFDNSEDGFILGIVDELVQVILATLGLLCVAEKSFFRIIRGPTQGGKIHQYWLKKAYSLQWPEQRLAEAASTVGFEGKNLKMEREKQEPRYNYPQWHD
ncbi:hypothetical protein ACLOJK_011814 [Asimina triloba]